jgi:hypothetical protein
VTGYALGAANIRLPQMGSKMAELLLSIYPVKGNNFEGESMYKLLSKYKKKKNWPGNILTAHCVTTNVFRAAQ